MKSKYIRHFIMAMVSSICLGFGCSFLIRGQIGSDAMTTLMEGLANILKTTSTVTNIYINITAFVLALIINKKNVGVVSLIYPFSTSFGISIGLHIIPSISNILIRMLFFVTGYFLLILAIGLNSKCECGKNPYDALSFGIEEKFNVSYARVRTSIDLAMLVSGIIFKGNYGVGTIICVFGIGKGASVIIKHLNENELYRKTLLLD